MRLNNIESLTSSYFSSRGEVRNDVNEDIKYIRGLVKYGMNEKAIEKVADLVNDLKEYKRENPKERIREVRMEIEQAFTDFNSGKIDRDECVSIVRESLENLEEMEDYFERLDDNGYEGIYPLYEEVMEKSGRLRSQLFTIVNNMNKATGGRDFNTLEELQKSIEKVIHYKPDKSIVEQKEKEEEISAEGMIIQGVQAMMERGKQQQTREVMEKVQSMIEEEKEEEKADTGKIPDDVEVDELFEE